MQVSHRQRFGLIGSIALAVMAATPLWSQQAPKGDAPALVDIAPEDWRARTLGRTVYYTIDGELFGREYYAPDGVSVVFQHASGVCLEGEWVYRAEISAYCYLWPAAVSCFRHVMRGDETLILSVNADGTAAGDAPQSVERIVTVPLSCGPAVTS